MYPIQDSVLNIVSTIFYPHAGMHIYYAQFTVDIQLFSS